MWVTTIVIHIPMWHTSKVSLSTLKWALNSLLLYMGIIFVIKPSLMSHSTANSHRHWSLNVTSRGLFILSAVPVTGPTAARLRALERAASQSENPVLIGHLSQTQPGSWQSSSDSSSCNVPASWAELAGMQCYQLSAGRIFWYRR